MSFLPSFLKSVQDGFFGYNAAANYTLSTAVDVNLSVVEHLGKTAPDSGASVDASGDGTLTLTTSTNVHLIPYGAGRITFRVWEFRKPFITAIDHYNLVTGTGNTTSGVGYNNQDFYSSYTITDRGAKSLVFFRGTNGPGGTIYKVNSTTVRFYSLGSAGFPFSFSVVGIR